MRGHAPRAPAQQHRDRAGASPDPFVYAAAVAAAAAAAEEATAAPPLRLGRGQLGQLNGSPARKASARPARRFLACVRFALVAYLPICPSAPAAAPLSTRAAPAPRRQNAVLHSLAARHRRVRIMPYYDLTAARADMHLEARPRRLPPAPQRGASLRTPSGRHCRRGAGRSLRRRPWPEDGSGISLRWHPRAAPVVSSAM